MLDFGSTWPQWQQRLIRLPALKIRVLIVALGIVLSGMLGLAVPNWGVAVLGVPIVVFGVLLLLAHPALGMFIVAATIPLENLAMFGADEVTLTRILGTVVFGVWLSRKLVLRESLTRVLSTPFFKVTVALLALVAASGLWATYASDVYSALFTLVQMLLWSLLVIDLANSWERIDWLAKALVLGGLASAGLIIQQYLVENAITGRAGENIAGGWNNSAQVVVTVVPFAFYLIRTRVGRHWRLMSVIYITMALFAVAVTFSRMGLIMLALVLSAHYWETIRGRTGRGLLIVLTGLAVFTSAIVLPGSGLGERLERRAQSIVPYLQDSVVPNDAGEVSSRSFHTRVGIAIFLDHPVLGAGYDNYRKLFLYDYQFRVPGSDRIYSGPRSPHGSYVGFLADLGIVGFVIWLGVLGIVLRNLYVAWATSSKTKPSRQHLLVQAVTYACLLQVVYAWHANIHLEKLVWLLLGLSVAVRLLAEQRDWSHRPVPTRSTSIGIETK